MQFAIDALRAPVHPKPSLNTSRVSILMSGRKIFQPIIPMTATEIVILIVLGGLAWLWFDSFKAREAGIQAVQRACEAEGLQLLDETIALVSLRFKRNDEGRLSLARVYAFEYSDTGDNRRRGSVHLLGHRVTMLNIGLRLVWSSNARR
jgi:hypothetical protein